MASLYPYFLTLHIFGAIMFVGTVFFEVLILEGIRKDTSARFMAAVEAAIGKRASRVMPFALLMIYGGGIAMVIARYGFIVDAPLGSTFATLLWIKILLAISVFGHFCTAMIVRVSKNGMSSRFFKNLHLSVFTHMVFIVLIAKWMFYLS